MTEIATTPGMAEMLARDGLKAARFYARFGITEEMFRDGVFDTCPEDTDLETCGQYLPGPEARNGLSKVRNKPLVNRGIPTDHRQVTLLRLQVNVRLGQTGREPLAVGKRNEPVLGSMPDLRGDLDLGKLEAPRMDECQVVVSPTHDPLPEGLAGVEHEIGGQLPSEGFRINGRQQRAERRRDSLRSCR